MPVGSRGSSRAHWRSSDPHVPQDVIITDQDLLSQQTLAWDSTFGVAWLVPGEDQVAAGSRGTGFQVGGEGAKGFSFGVIGATLQKIWDLAKCGLGLLLIEDRVVVRVDRPEPARCVAGKLDDQLPRRVRETAGSEWLCAWTGDWARTDGRRATADRFPCPDYVAAISHFALDPRGRMVGRT